MEVVFRCALICLSITREVMNIVICFVWVGHCQKRREPKVLKDQCHILDPKTPEYLEMHPIGDQCSGQQSPSNISHD